MRVWIIFIALAAGLLAQDAAPEGLRIENVTFREYDDGPVIAKETTFAAGQKVAIDFQIAGYQIFDDKRELAKRVHLKWTWKAVDGDGTLLVPSQSGAIEDTVQPEDKDWMPKVRSIVPLPPFLADGNYGILVAIQDVYGKLTREVTIPIRVAGKKLPAADQITVANVGFFREPDAARPLEVAAFRPGDTVYVKLDITGFTRGKENQYAVRMGFQLKAPDGRVLIDAPDVFTDANKAFYPVRFVSTNLQLDVDRNNPKGSYVLLLKVTDELGSKTVETPFPFSIE